MNSFAASLECVLPELDERLASPSAVEKLRALARALPPLHLGGFECRLGGEGGGVDLQQGIAPADGSPATLRHFIATTRAAAGTPLDPAWAQLERFAESWENPASPLHTGVPELWLECDAPPGDTSGGGIVPSIFASLRPAVTSANASLALASTFLAALLGHEPPVALRDALARCADACPPGARISHVGVMLGRESRGFRVHIAGLELRAFREYLTRVGWPGDPDDIERIARWLLDAGDAVVLCLNVGAKIYPQVGLECFFTLQQGMDPRWEPLLEHLVARGLCTPDKRDALLQWPGRVTPVVKSVPWPDELIAESLTQPANRFGLIARKLSHIKVSWSPGGALDAKGYFGFAHVWYSANGSAQTPARATSTVSAPRPKAVRREGTSLAESVADALEFLLTARNQGGWWRDFYDINRAAAHDRRITGFASDEWVTAYTAAVLATLPDPRARDAAADAWTLLAARRGPHAGWGYHALLPHDADTTSWVLRLASALAVPETARVRAAAAYLRKQTHADGGVSTYAVEDSAALARFLRMDGPYDGWCARHTCVTAAAAVLGYADASLEYLLAHQLDDGRWTGHWWDDDEYATVRAVEALVRAPGDAARDAVRRAARWAASRIDDRGAVHSACHGGASPFATALVVRAIQVAGAAGAFPEGAAAIARATTWLRSQQRADGSFPASSRLRVPGPSAIDPLADPATTVVYVDRDRIFTTATVLAALAASGQSARASDSAR